MDSDDYIEPEMYRELYLAITDTGADVSQCKFIRDDGLTPMVCPGTGERKLLKFDSQNGLYRGNYKEKDDGNGIYGGIVTRLFKRDLIYSHDISFPAKVLLEAYMQDRSPGS